MTEDCIFVKANASARQVSSIGSPTKLNLIEKNFDKQVGIAVENFLRLSMRTALVRAEAAKYGHFTAAPHAWCGAHLLRP